MSTLFRPYCPPVTIYPTQNSLPGCPEVFTAEIQRVEEDIAIWDGAVLNGRLKVARLQLRIAAELEQIRRDEQDAAFARGNLIRLREQFSLVDRRVAECDRRQEISHALHEEKRIAIRRKLRKFGVQA